MDNEADRDLKLMCLVTQLKALLLNYTEAEAHHQTTIATILVSTKPDDGKGPERHVKMCTHGKKMMLHHLLETFRDNWLDVTDDEETSVEDKNVN